MMTNKNLDMEVVSCHKTLAFTQSIDKEQADEQQYKFIIYY